MLEQNGEPFFFLVVVVVVYLQSTFTLVRLCHIRRKIQPNRNCTKAVEKKTQLPSNNLLIELGFMRRDRLNYNNKK